MEVEAKEPTLRPLLVEEIATKKGDKQQRLKRTADQLALEASAAKRRADRASSSGSSSYTRQVG
jgi:hypothetical protein